MSPLNLDDRRKAFCSFFLLFLLAIGIVIAITLFSVQVPLSENARFRNEMFRQEKEQLFFRMFTGQLSEIMNLLDSVNQVEQVQAELLDGKIIDQLKRMNGAIETDSLQQKELFLNVLQSLADLQAAKKQIRESGKAERGLADLKQENMMLRQQLQQSQDQVVSLLQQSR